MGDRVVQILRNYIANAEEQLELVRGGMRLDGVTHPIPDTEIELIGLIAKWEGEIRRHEERNA